MKKKIKICLVLLLIFALSACGGNNESKDPGNNNANSNNENKVTENADKIEDEKNVPEKALLKGVPIYPGAQVFGDVTSHKYKEYTYLEWHYKTNASANEIVEFFKKEFNDMGFEIEGFATYVIDDTFAVTIWNSEEKDATVGFVSFTETEDFSEEVNPDTSGRHYRIRINTDKWMDR